MKYIALIFIILLIAPVVGMGDRTIYYPLTTSSSGNITYNFYGTMNQTPNMTAGAQGVNGTPGVPGVPGLDGGAGDMSWNLSYFLRDGSRTMTGEKIQRDVDNDLLSLYGGNAIAGGTGILSLFGKTSGNPNAVELNVGAADGISNVMLTGWKGGDAPRMDMNGYNISGIRTVTASDDAINLSYTLDLISGVRDTDSTVTFNVSADEVLKKGQAVYISGATGVNVRVAKADPYNVLKTRVVGIVTTDLAINEKGFIRRQGTLINVDTRATNVYINPFGETWNAGDLLFLDGNGGFSKNRNASGRTVKAAYNLRDGNINGVLLAYPFENPVWITSASGENIVLRIGDTNGFNNISIRNYTNGQVGYIDSLGNINFNASTYSSPAAALKAADDHIASNASATLRIADNHIASNLTVTSRTSIIPIESDFYDNTAAGAIPQLFGAAIGSGALSASTVAMTKEHPGVISMRDSTTIAGGFRFGCVGAQLIGGGETFEVIFQSVGVRATQTAVFGWSDSSVAATLPVDGIFFNMAGTGAAVTIRGNTSANSVRSGTLTTFSPVASTWYRGVITVNSDATLVTYEIFNDAGVSQWTDTVATNIPTAAARVTSPCLIVAESTTDAAADIIVLDYAKWSSTRTLVR